MLIYRRQSKYKAKKTVVDEITFDSKLEAEYYLYLKQLKKLGKILDFERQVKFVLVDTYKQKETDKTVRGVNYVVDFVVYQVNGKISFIDTKGFETADFKIKKKLFESKYNRRLILVKRKGKGWIEE